jgi:hypothetical protein
MKNKDLKKIAKIITDEIRNYNSPMAEKVEENIWCDYNSEVSTKFKKMILSLSNYKKNLRFDVNDCRISISTDDLTLIKSSKTSSNKLYDEENYLRIEVTKEGFSVNHGYNKRSFYKDDNMYNDLIDDIKDITKKINSDNFLEIWDDVMKESGVIRDSNLDDLLNG